MTEPVPHTEPAEKNIVDRSIEVISKVLSYSFALSIVVTIYDVVTTCIAVAFLIGGSYALMRREHIRITAVYTRFSRRNRVRLDILGSLLAIVYLAAFAWFSFVMAQIAISDWEVSGSAWAQPTPIVVKTAMVLGAALMIVQMLSNIRADFRALREED